MILLKKYQKEKVEELKLEFLKLLNKSKASSIVFEAPTGSGKTIMMQEFLKQISEIPKPKKLAFIWISVNDLSNQSKESFEKNLEGTSLIFSQLKDIKEKTLKENEILFINWEKIKSKDSATGEWKVLAMKDNEKDENIPNYMENTRSNGIDIILIIDESHKQLKTPKAQELINIYFKPIIQIEVSATPDSENYDTKISIDINDVIESGMIKKEILVNQEIDIQNDESLGTDSLIIKKAIEKQKELAKFYNNLNTKIKPLLLIQLPSESQNISFLDRTKIERVKQILRENYNITVENQKLAVWLSEDKTNKDLININNSPVEVLLFKQAIATGWDCPRAQILVIFREIGSITFEIQTVGRILRMPEQKHYENEILNKAYVYTDIAKNSILISSTAKNIIKNMIGVRKMNLYKSFSLSTQFASRGDYNDIGSDFYEIFFRYFLENIIFGKYEKTLNFLEILENKKLFEKLINTNDLDIQENIIKDGKIFVDIDKHTGEEIILSDNYFQTKEEEELIELQFDNFCRLNVGPQFGNIARSYKIIKESIFLLFEKYILGEDYSRINIQKLVLKNKDKFIEYLNEIKNYYEPLRKKSIEKKLEERFKNKKWEIPSSIGFAGENIEEINSKKYIYSPGFIKLDSEIEREFIEYLDNQEEILFWYKNGIKLDIYFGIKYEIFGESKMFYPDFMVYFKSGIIGIFDTKDGNTLTALDTVEKAKSLEFFTLKEKNIKIISGIIKRIGVGKEKYFMINKVGNFDFNNNSSFQIYNDDLVRNYKFKDFGKISESYKKEIEEKIILLEKELNKKEKEYIDFVQEQKNYETLDNESMIEKMKELEELKRKIKELKGCIL